MINRLILRNFQAHKFLRLNFSPGVNTICGTTDSGKSSIIRALRWVSQNLPKGTSFIRHGEKKASVTIDLDGVRVTRERGGENTYSIKTDEGKNTFRSFNNNVPEPVQDILRMSSINFQLQHDPPFWLSDSAGEVSRQLNAVVNLEEIDRVLSRAASKVRQSKTLRDSQEKQVAISKEAWESTRYIVHADELLKAVEAIDAKRAEQLPVMMDLAYLIETTENQEAEIEMAVNYANRLQPIRAKGRVLKRGYHYRDQFVSLLEDIEECLSIKEPPNLGPLAVLKVKLMEELERYESLKYLITSLDISERKVRMAQAQKKEAVKNLQEGVKTCPTCGKPLQ